MNIVFIILCISIAVILFRKKIADYFKSDIEKIKDLNYTNDEIQNLIKKYTPLETQHLIKILEETKVTNNESRALRKVLADRNYIIPYK